MNVAAYQAPLFASGSMTALPLIVEKIRKSDRDSVDIFCCPEGILGGLADHTPKPLESAINVGRGDLDRVLVPLASDTVTTIIGFTEITDTGLLYNAAAVFHKVIVIRIYRKRHPAINRSVYAAGSETPVFTVGEATVGILICNDSNFLDLAKKMSDRGASVLFIPGNNGLPIGKADVSVDARRVDAQLARDNNLWVAVLPPPPASSHVEHPKLSIPREPAEASQRHPMKTSFLGKFEQSLPRLVDTFGGPYRSTVKSPAQMLYPRHFH